MSDAESRRLEQGANWYMKEQIDFDKRLIGMRYETLKPHLKGPAGLEMGPAEGEMTRLLMDDFESLTVVDGAAELLERIPDAPKLTKVHALFEQYSPSRQFDSIVMEHILEHVEDPVALLRRVKGWLKPGGRLLVGVPNAGSVHRLVAVKMGLLKEAGELNARDLALGHRRVYTWAALRADLERAGLAVQQMKGVFFKPVSNQQIQDHWDERMIRGFYELGADLPELAAEISVVCSPA